MIGIQLALLLVVSVVFVSMATMDMLQYNIIHSVEFMEDIDSRFEAFFLFSMMLACFGMFSLLMLLATLLAGTRDHLGRMQNRLPSFKKIAGKPIPATIPEHIGDSTCVWCLEAQASNFSPYVCGHNPVCRQCYPHWERGDRRSCERCNQPRF